MYVFDHVHLRAFLESNSFFIVENCIQLIHSQCNTTFFYRSLNWFDLESVFFLLVLFLFSTYLLFSVVFFLTWICKIKPGKSNAKQSWTYQQLLWAFFWFCSIFISAVTNIAQEDIISFNYPWCIVNILLVFGKHFETNNYSNRNHAISC